jgi:hypothetical protein
MGLLDDAIREHLELKKRHGADPTEIAQLEREAFGPARRGPEPLEVPGDPVLVEPEVDAPEYEPPAEPLPADAPERPLPVESEAVPEPPPPAPEPGPAPEPPARATEPEPEPEPARRPEPAADAEPHEGEPDAEGEDVLEETPEFLQETPEHDRLWFEQRPPRDFDFDG